MEDLLYQACVIGYYVGEGTLLLILLVVFCNMFVQFLSKQVCKMRIDREISRLPGLTRYNRKFLKQLPDHSRKQYMHAWNDDHFIL